MMNDNDDIIINDDDGTKQQQQQQQGNNAANTSTESFNLDRVNNNISTDAEHPDEANDSTATASSPKRSLLQRTDNNDDRNSTLL